MKPSMILRMLQTYVPNLCVLHKSTTPIQKHANFNCLKSVHSGLGSKSAWLFPTEEPSWTLKANHGRNYESKASFFEKSLKWPFILLISISGNYKSVKYWFIVKKVLMLPQMWSIYCCLPVGIMNQSGNLSVYKWVITSALFPSL